LLDRCGDSVLHRRVSDGEGNEVNGDCNICINGKLPSYSASCVECGLLRKNYKPMTNANRIRAMSDEELAQWIENIRMCCANDLCGRICPLAEVCYANAEAPKETIDWLKAPAEVDE
jgi:hypothetical protein